MAKKNLKGEQVRDSPVIPNPLPVRALEGTELAELLKALNWLNMKTLYPSAGALVMSSAV